MKSITTLSFLMLAGAACNTFADNCTGESASQQDATSILNNQRIKAVAPGGEEWEEDHCTNFRLYKVGTMAGPPKHPERESVDPRRVIGSWSSSGSNIIYNYGDPGGPYTFELWLADSGTYYFCKSDGTQVATIIEGPNSFTDSCSD